MKKVKAENIDEYIAAYPKDIQKLLKQIRTTVKKAAPKAEERISYGIPAFTLNGNLAYFAAFKNHIGFYPTPQGIDEFKKELSKYKEGRGSVQFQLDEPMPLKLITRMVKFRAKKNLENVKSKTKSKKK